jgi:NADPH:quinone reductase-like Zn-dependent oxidoreductase
MKAIVGATYGSSDRLKLDDIPMPQIGDTDVLVKVRAASVNALDWHMATGRPYLMRPMMGTRKPKRAVRGVDVAGEVEAVGAKVTQFKPGDAVFGVGSGSFAEYVSADETELIVKPDALSYEQAASLPIAGFTALQALRKFGQLQSGQSVLINGAAGGVGNFTVQIAKALGAHVTGVCSTRNVEFVRSVGADEVVDYTAQDFSRQGKKYDLIVDAVGNRSLSAFRRALTTKGTLVLVGGGGGNWLGPVAQFLRTMVQKPFISQRIVIAMAKPDQDSLRQLAELCEVGKVRPAVDRTYSLPETPEAVSLLETHHARGKSVIVVQS